MDFLKTLLMRWWCSIRSTEAMNKWYYYSLVNTRGGTRKKFLLAKCPDEGSTRSFSSILMFLWRPKTILNAFWWKLFSSISLFEIYSLYIKNSSDCIAIHHIKEERKYAKSIRFFFMYHDMEIYIQSGINTFFIYT